MPLFNETPRKTQRIIMHEKGEYDAGTEDKYVYDKWPGGDEARFNIMSTDRNKYEATRDSLLNTIPTGIGKMFESDAQRTVAGDVNDLYDDLIIDMSTEGAEERLRTALRGQQAGDEFVMYGHSDTRGNPMMGGIELSSLKDDLQEGVNCFLGACHGKDSGQVAANALGRDVTAQIGDDFWTGSQIAETTLESFTRPFPGIFKKGEERSKVYSPVI